MSDKKLKTAILGLNEASGVLLEAASKAGIFEVEAVADKDSKLAERTAKQFGCVFFDDYRQLIIQNKFDCLIVSEGLYACEQWVREAIKGGCNVLKFSPPGRDFEEAAELVRRAEAADVKLAIANTARFRESFVEFGRYLEGGKLEHPFLITATCNVDSSGQPPWYTDPKLSGGGVLLRSCYELVDQIVLNFGVPQKVYSLNVSTAEDRQQRLYLTEDTALVTMTFGDRLIGNIVASRQEGGEMGQCLKVYGKRGEVCVSETSFCARDFGNDKGESFQYDDNQLRAMVRLLENFGFSILRPKENKLCSSGRENLASMAVIEAAYLSARTGFPEEPARILEISPIGPGETLSLWAGHK